MPQDLSDTGASSSSPLGQLPSPHLHAPLAAAGQLGNDLAEGSVRFFHDELRLSLPFNGEHSLSLEDLKKTSPRDIICIYEVPPLTELIVSLCGRTVPPTCHLPPPTNCLILHVHLFSIQRNPRRI